MGRKQKKKASQREISQKKGAAERKKYEINSKAVNVLLGSMSESEFAKVMQLHSAK